MQSNQRQAHVMDESLFYSFAICFIVSSVCAAYLKVMRKEDFIKCIGLAILSGFASFVIVILLNVLGLEYWYYDEIFVSAFYTLFIGDRSFFDRL